MSFRLRAERAWAAGFFDGEGSCIGGKAFSLMTSQVEREPLERFAVAVNEPNALIVLSQATVQEEVAL